MKKGISSQIFIFIFALIMIAFVLGFGIKSLTTVKGTADKVELLTFVTQLDDVVQEYYAFDVGSSKVVTLSLPTKVEQVCFLQPGKVLTKRVDDDLSFLLRNNKKDNLYVLPLHAFTAPAPDFTIDNLLVDAATNPLCFPVQGRLAVMLETVLYEDTVFVQVKEV